MQIVRSLPYSQEPGIAAYPKLDKSSPPPYPQFPYDLKLVVLVETGVRFTMFWDMNPRALIGDEQHSRQKTVNKIHKHVLILSSN
jgi:hypothetical protein